MSIIEDNRRILDLLGKGLTPVQVISVTGCRVEFLQSLLQNDEFKEAIQEALAGNMREVQEDEIVTSKYLALEHSILKQIEVDLPTAELRDTIRALEVVSKRQDAHMQRKIAPIASINNITQIALVIPEHAVPEYALTANKEVAKIGDKTMSPLDSKEIPSLFKQLKECITTKRINNEPRQEIAEA